MGLRSAIQQRTGLSEAAVLNTLDRVLGDRVLTLDKAVAKGEELIRLVSERISQQQSPEGTIPAFYFKPAQLDLLASRLESFRDAQPFPHVVMDDFLPEYVVNRLIEEFPGQDDIDWSVWGPGRTRKLKVSKLNKYGQSDENHFGPFTRHFMNQLLSSTFVSFVERITGVPGLIVDPSHNGCGLHSTGRGGRLMIHTDTNRHPHSRTKLHQIFNLIVFLNDDWKEEYGGHLELWTKDRKPFKKVLPIANRAVLFETNTRSFHGHPTPLACPEGRRRNTLAVYYYTLDRPADQGYAGMQRSVYWVPTAPEDKRGAEKAVAFTREKLASLHNKTKEMPLDALPFDYDSVDGKVRLTFIDETSLDETELDELRQKHLAPLTDAEFDHVVGDSKNHSLLGFVHSSKAASIDDEDSLPLFFNISDASIYIKQPSQPGPVFFVYSDRLFRFAGIK